MIFFERITAIDLPVFDRMYAASETAMDNGSYPWHLLPAKSAEEKRAYILAQFQETMASRAGIGWQVKVDGEVLLLCAGGFEGDLIRWTMGLLSPRNGSRSWLYDPGYEIARNAFWESVGVRGWTLAFAAQGQAVHAHVMRKREGGALLAAVSEEPAHIAGFSNIVITKD